MLRGLFAALRPSGTQVLNLHISKKNNKVSGVEFAEIEDARLALVLSHN